MATGPGTRYAETALEFWDTGGSRSVFISGATGDVDINGNCVIDGFVSIGGDVDIGGTVNIHGDVTISGNVAISGDVTADDINLTGSITLSGNLTGSGSISGVDINGTTITGGTISGTTISGTTITGTTISGTSFSGGSISGTTLSSVTVDAAAVDTAFLYAGISDIPLVSGSVFIAGDLTVDGTFSNPSTRDSKAAIRAITLDQSRAFLEAAEPVTYRRPVNWNRDKRTREVTNPETGRKRKVHRKPDQLRHVSVMAEPLDSAGFKEACTYDDGSLAGVNLLGWAYLIPAVRQALAGADDSRTRVEALHARLERLERSVEGGT